MEDGDNNEYSIKLHINIYGQKQAGRFWYKYLAKKLIMELGLTNSYIDEFVFYRVPVMYILYKYYSIISVPNKENMDAVLEDLKKANLGVTVEGTLEELLGVNINRRTYGSIHLTQPHLIYQIVNYLGQENP